MIAAARVKNPRVIWSHRYSRAVWRYNMFKKSSKIIQRNRCSRLSRMAWFSYSWLRYAWVRAFVGIHSTIILIMTECFLAAVLAYSFATIQKNMIGSMTICTFTLRSLNLVVAESDLWWLKTKNKPITKIQEPRGELLIGGYVMCCSERICS